MIETSVSPRLAALRPFFPADVPNAAILEGVLSGANPGHFVVDDAERPTWCVLRPAFYEFTFAGGALAARSLPDAIASLRRRGNVHLVVRDDDSSRSVGAPPCDAQIDRWEFRGPAANADALARRLPEGCEGCEVRRIDAVTFERCLWIDDMIATFGSAERYLAESVGMCLVRGEDVLSEAHAAFWGDGIVEIGAITAEHARGHGHAAVTVARLVQECRARGAGTVWSCDRDNHASTRLARKLGYARQRPYRLLEFRKMG